MAQKKSIIPIIGRMDQDTEELLMRQGDHTYAHNVRFSEKLNAAFEVIGNTKAGDNGISGAYTCRGALDAGRYIFYAISLSSNYYIIRLDTVTETHAIVVNETYLNFTQAVKFQYNEENDTLYWTDGKFGSFTGSANVPLGYNPPRMVNVGKAILFYSSGGTDPNGYSAMSQQHLDVIKYPSPIPASCKYTTDEERKSNVLLGKMVQFSTQYIYEDNTRSVWSVWSQVTLPVISEGDEISSEHNDYLISQFQNLVQVTINTGHETVKKIRVAVRDQNTGLAGIFEEVDKEELSLSDDASYVVNYYGDEITVEQDSNDFYNFDLVPITANDQFLVSTRASSYNLTYGGIREGFGNPIIDVDYKALAHKLYDGRPWYGGALNTYFNWREVVQVSTSGPDAILNFVELNQLPTEHALFEQFALEIDMTFSGGSGGMEFIFMENLVEHISTTAFGGVGVGYAITSAVFDELVARGYTGLTLDATLPRITVSGVTPATAWVGKLNAYNPRRSSFKKGAEHPIGIVYFDRAKRDGGVAKIGDLYVPFDKEYVDKGDWPTGSFAIDSDEFRTSLRLLLNHQPPDWATHYAIVYQGNKRIGSFERRVVMAIKREGTPADNVRLFLDNSHFAYFGNQADRTANQIEVGDIVRVVREKEDLTAPYTRPNYADYIELEVLKADFLPAQGFYVEVKWENYADFTHTSSSPTFGNDSGMVVEIIKQRQSSDLAPYHTISRVLEVTNPHLSTRLHKGQDLSDLVVRQVVFTGGPPYRIDVYGDYSYLIGQVAGRSFTVSGSGAGNDGTYAFSSVVLDDSSTVPVTQLFTNDATVADEFAGNDARVSIETDQVVGSLPAIVHLDRGDVYCRQVLQRFRVTSPGVSGTIDRDTERSDKHYWIESFHYTDKYISDSFDKGQPYVELGDLQGHRYRKELLRNSLKYVEGTLVNGFSSFLSPNQAAVAEQDGDIERIIQVGFTLKVVQHDRVSSVYLEASETSQVDGSNQLVNINKVLGSIRPQEEELGTTHPYSVVKIDRDLYFYDQNRRCVVKNTPGGQVTISARDLGMNSFFNDQPRFDQSIIVAGHDRENDEVVFCFDKKSGTDFTVGFNYKKNVWTSFYGFTTDMLVTSNDDVLYSFNDGNPYKHNDGNIREFYSVVSDFILDLVMNEDPTVKKVFDVHEMGANQKIEVNPVTVPADAENADGMETRIPTGLQTVNEGTVFGSYLRDRNSPGYATGFEDQAMYEGRPIRGLMAKHRYIKTGSTSDQLKITHVVVLVTASEPI